METEALAGDADNAANNGSGETPTNASSALRRSSIRPTLLESAAKHRKVPSFLPSAFEISPDGTLIPTDVETVLLNASSSLSSTSKLNPSSTSSTTCTAADVEKALPPIVLDADIANPQVLALLRTQILDRLRLPALMNRHLTMKQLQTPQVLALNRAVLVVFRVLPQIDNCVSAQLRATYHSAALAIENGPLLLINILASSEATASQMTYDKAEQKELRSRHLGKDAISLMCRRESLPSASTAGALAIWLGFHLQQVTTATQQLRGRVLEMSERSEEEVGTITLPEIVDVKDCFLRLYAIAEEQDECTQNLASGETVTRALDFDKMKGYVSVLLSTAGSNERMLTRLEKRVDDLRQTYEAHQQNRINRRLGLLTIVSAIFLPLSLLSGIFGMNFQVMPALTYELGYYLCLGGMALIACILLLGVSTDLAGFCRCKLAIYDGCYQRFVL